MSKNPAGEPTDVSSTPIGRPTAGWVGASNGVSTSKYFNSVFDSALPALFTTSSNATICR